jgi:zinc transporter ZupT
VNFITINEQITRIMTTTLVIGLLIPLLGTMLGSAFVFFMKGEMSVRLQKTLLGFASGVMVAASVWSLLIPSMEMVADSGRWSVLPAAVGFLLGMGFLLMIDELTPHLHIGTDKPEGMRSHLSKTAMLALAAGAMFYVVVEELIPEASNGQHSNLSTIGFAIGFVLMMVLDVVMG